MKFRLEVDLLIIGCEASLWIGEQFASDLQNLFPALRVVAMSANKVIGKLPCCPSLLNSVLDTKYPLFVQTFSEYTRAFSEMTLSIHPVTRETVQEFCRIPAGVRLCQVLHSARVPCR